MAPTHCIVTVFVDTTKTDNDVCEKTENIKRRSINCANLSLKMYVVGRELQSCYKLLLEVGRAARRETSTVHSTLGARLHVSATCGVFVLEYTWRYLRRIYVASAYR